jgi:Arf-GAP/coiled-coil/ANK repeat/PH domain-containing protein
VSAFCLFQYEDDEPDAQIIGVFALAGCEAHLLDQDGDYDDDEVGDDDDPENQISRSFELRCEVPEDQIDEDDPDIGETSWVFTTSSTDDLLEWAKAISPHCLNLRGDGEDYEDSDGSDDGEERSSMEGDSDHLQDLDALVSPPPVAAMPAGMPLVPPPVPRQPGGGIVPPSASGLAALHKKKSTFQHSNSSSNLFQGINQSESVVRQKVSAVFNDGDVASQFNKLFDSEFKWQNQKVKSMIASKPVPGSKAARMLQTPPTDINTKDFNFSVTNPVFDGSSPGGNLRKHSLGLLGANAPKAVVPVQRGIKELQRISLVDVKKEITSVVDNSDEYKKYLLYLENSFRSTEQNFERISANMREFIQQQEKTVDLGNRLNVDMKEFSNVLKNEEDKPQMPQLNSPPTVDATVLSNFVGKWCTINREIQIMQSVLDNQLSNGFVFPLLQAFQDDVKKAHEARRTAEEAAQKHKDAFTKLQKAGKKPDKKMKKLEHDAAVSMSSAQELCWMEFKSIDQMKSIELVERLCDYVYMQKSYFRSGHNILSAIEPEIREYKQSCGFIRRQIADRKVEFDSEFQNHLSELLRSEPGTALAAEGQGLKREGYLNKYEPGKNAMTRTWRKRYFVLDGVRGKLGYRRANGPGMKGDIDLRLATIRVPMIQQRPCSFEIIGPKINLVLQASNDYVMKQWIHDIQAVTAYMLGGGDGDIEGRPSLGAEDRANDERLAAEKVQQLSLQVAELGNHVCADCQAEHPEWCSINWGVLICVDCSGVHRSLGTHLTKVRSLQMDSLDPSLLHFMTETGNIRMNLILENPVMLEGTDRIDSTSQRANRDVYIKNKYALKKFVLPMEDKTVLQESLIESAAAGDLAMVMTRIAQGAIIDWVGPHYGKTALHAAAENGHAVVVEALCSNQAEVDKVDGNSQTALHICALKGHISVAEALLYHKASPSAVDALGRSATKVAILNGQAQLSKLLLSWESK